MFLKAFVKEVKRRIKNRMNYWKNELRYKIIGDNRDTFTKKVHRCRQLELPDMIHNLGDKGQC